MVRCRVARYCCYGQLISSRFSLMTALLNWLGETPAQRSNPSGTPGYLSFGMASKSQHNVSANIQC
jgi:hypothetical protein